MKVREVQELFVSSAYKRHGKIIEAALDARQRESPAGRTFPLRRRRAAESVNAYFKSQLDDLPARR